MGASERQGLQLQVTLTDMISQFRQKLSALHAAAVPTFFSMQFLPCSAFPGRFRPARSRNSAKWQTGILHKRFALLRSLCRNRRRLLLDRSAFRIKPQPLFNNLRTNLRPILDSTIFHPGDGYKQALESSSGFERQTEKEQHPLTTN